jgi:hypothetical protein
MASEMKKSMENYRQGKGYKAKRTAAGDRRPAFGTD